MHKVRKAQFYYEKKGRLAAPFFIRVFDVAYGYQTVPRAETGSTRVTIPFRWKTIWSNRLLTTQVWLGTTRTTEPIAGELVLTIGEVDHGMFF